MPEENKHDISKEILILFGLGGSIAFCYYAGQIILVLTRENYFPFDLLLVVVVLLLFIGFTVAPLLKK